MATHAVIHVQARAALQRSLVVHVDVGVGVTATLFRERGGRGDQRHGKRDQQGRERAHGRAKSLVSHACSPFPEPAWFSPIRRTYRPTGTRRTRSTGPPGSGRTGFRWW